jgi:hypothetical protein
MLVIETLKCKMSYFLNHMLLLVTLRSIFRRACGFQNLVWTLESAPLVDIGLR